MPIRRDIPVHMTAEEVMAAVSRGRRDPSWMAAPAKKALEQAISLIDPVVVFDWVTVTDVEGEGVWIIPAAGGKPFPLRLGPNAGLMEGARVALASVNSIGGRLDDAVRTLNAQGDAFEGYLLDCVGVVALSKVGDAAARMAEDRAKEMGWGVGARLAPGSLVGWDTARQTEICDLLPLEAADIRLTDSGLIVPFKSASGLIGVGPGYRDTTVGSVCGLCRLKDGCWRRKD
ncbi:MAG: vitamin B12 dependent-methionine synthase activation domain-containing protein [Desulfobacterales bacterium]|nr:vitamin B12 dependent-methionine synthase activation domain-containing protein [Desulfobacterales bacterium]